MYRRQMGEMDVDDVAELWAAAFAVLDAVYLPFGEGMSLVTSLQLLTMAHTSIDVDDVQDVPEPPK